MISVIFKFYCIFKDILIKEGVLTNSTFTTSQTVPEITNIANSINTSQNQHNSANISNEQSHIRKHSTEMSSIIKDESLVSIQSSSKDHFSLNLNELLGSTNNENQSESAGESKPQPVSLIELCDPKNFSLSLSDENAKKKPQKITKKDFFNATNFQSNLNAMDPFSLLDSLKK